MMNERMTRQMDKLEKEMNRSEVINRRTKELRNIERNLAVQPTGRNEMSENLNYSSDWAKRLEEELQNDANRKTEKTWKEKEVNNVWSSKRLEDDASSEKVKKVNDMNKTLVEKTKEMRKEKTTTVNEDLKVPEKPEKVVKNKVKGMMKIRRWFGNKSSGEEISSDESTDDDNWDTVTRRRLNKEKKKKRKAGKEMTEEITFKKTNHILGIGPISDEKLTSFHKANKNYKEAKIEAVRDFLRVRLRFNEEELEEMRISDAIVSAKRDGVVYAAFEDKGNIHEIRVRTVECREDDIIIRNFIPPQIYDRYMFVNRLCQKLREKDENLRTQVRFGVRDVEVMIKTKGTKDPY